MLSRAPRGDAADDVVDGSPRFIKHLARHKLDIFPSSLQFRADHSTITSERREGLGAKERDKRERKKRASQSFGQ